MEDAIVTVGTTADKSFVIGRHREEKDFVVEDTYFTLQD